MNNRFFTAVLVAVTTLLLFLLLFLIGGLIVRLLTSQPLRPTDYRSIAFSIRLSLYTASIAAVIATLIGVPIAYFLTRHDFPGHSFIDTLLDLPVFLSPIALGAMLMIFFNTPLGRWIEGITGPVVFEVKGIIVAQFFVTIGLGIRLLKNTFEHIDRDYEDISRVLGASKLQTFRRVVLPLARRGIITSLLLVWARAVGEFGATVALAGATPMKTSTIPVGIYLSFGAADLHSATVYILLLIAVSLTVLFTTRWLLGVKNGS